jgi:hypothetical protein
MLLVALTSIRLKDAVRVRFSADADRPNNRIYGLFTTRDGKNGTKDGAPRELFAPAEGILGRVSGLPHHLAEMAGAGGNAFPNFCGPHGSRTHIDRAEGLCPNTCLTALPTFAKISRVSWPCPHSPYPKGKSKKPASAGTPSTARFVT